MKTSPLKLPFEYCDTPELRVLDLTADGIPCIPVLGLTRIGRGGRPTTSEEHVHEGCIEISYCQRGELVFESEGREFPVQPGCVFVSRPNEPHRLKTYPRGLLMYWFFFRLLHGTHRTLALPEREASWLTDSLHNMPNRLFTGGDRVRIAFQRLFTAYDHEPRPSPQRTLRLRLAVLDLILSVLDASTGGKALPDDDRVKQAIAEIRSNPVKKFSIDELAARISISPSNLILRFKRLAGLPPQAFRNACRIDLAKKELADSSKTVTSIALSLGYSSAQNFATQFRLATGKTPRGWHTTKR